MSVTGGYAENIQYIWVAYKLKLPTVKLKENGSEQPIRNRNSGLWKKRALQEIKG